MWPAKKQISQTTTNNHMDHTNLSPIMGNSNLKPERIRNGVLIHDSVA